MIDLDKFKIIDYKVVSGKTGELHKFTTEVWKEIEQNDYIPQGGAYGSEGEIFQALVKVSPK